MEYSRDTILCQASKLQLMISTGLKKVRKIGVAIPAHNRIANTLTCLRALEQSTLPPDLVVVVDDGSSDNTTLIIRQEFPKVEVLAGEGNLWWTGATNLAVKHCLASGCTSVLLLNQDCDMTPTALEKLVNAANIVPDAILASVNVYRELPERIHWAGTRWIRWRRFPLMFTSKAIKVPGMTTNGLPKMLISCDMTGGRGVLIPKSVFQKIGLFDDLRLPQYGADNDFTLRARRTCIPIYVVPDALVAVGESESVIMTGRGQETFLERFRNLLWSQRNGNAARVWWILSLRHTPKISVVPTYLRMIAVTLKRAWQEAR